MQDNPVAACALVEAAAPGRARLRVLLGLLLGPVLVYLWLISSSLGSGGYDMDLSNFDLSPEYIERCYSYYMVQYGWGLLEYAVFGIGWLWITLVPVAGLSLRSLNLKAASLWRDVLHALVLVLICGFGLDWVCQWVCVALQSPDSGIFNLTSIAAGTHPLLLGLMAGPYAWLAGGLFEEFLRVCLLLMLWKLDNRRGWHFACIALAGLLFGACHIYQGPTGVIAAVAKVLLFATYYYLYGRPLAMILSHGAYDTYAIIYGAIYYTAAWRSTPHS